MAHRRAAVRLHLPLLLFLGVILLLSGAPSVSGRRATGGRNLRQTGEEHTEAAAEAQVVEVITERQHHVAHGLPALHAWDVAAYNSTLNASSSVARLDGIVSGRGCSGGDLQTKTLKDAADTINSEGGYNLRDLQDYKCLLENASSIFPLERGLCGANATWPQRYADMHRQTIVVGWSSRPRVTLALIDKTGLADRLLMVLTAFAYALASDRALLMVNSAAPPMWPVLRSSYIDWRYNELMKVAEATHSSQALACRRGFWFSPAEHAHYRTVDIKTLGGDAAMTIMQNCYGILWDMVLANANSTAVFAEMGLNEDNLYPCLFDYVLRPSPNVLAAFRDELAVLQDPEYYVMGLQVRVGDHQMFNGDPGMEALHVAHHYIHCALQLEQQLHDRGMKKTVLWLLVTDSASLRHSMIDAYPGKVLVKSGVTPDHIQRYEHGGLELHEEHGWTNENMVLATGELWIFNLAQLHIVSRDSNFGKVGGLISGRKHLYAVHRDSFPHCTLDAPTSLAAMAGSWVGIR